jgi:hypothetical protein
MVKDLKPKPTSLPRPVPKKDEPADGKGNRLTLRMHPDIMELLSARAYEQGVSRSHLVEQILVGFMRLDPRNPKMDAVGRIIDGAETPLALYEKPRELAARWQKFTDAHTLVIGTPPRSDLMDDRSGYWDAPSHAAREPEDQDSLDERAQRGRWARRRLRNP